MQQQICSKINFSFRFQHASFVQRQSGSASCSVPARYFLANFASAHQEVSGELFRTRDEEKQGL